MTNQPEPTEEEKKVLQLLTQMGNFFDKNEEKITDQVEHVREETKFNPRKAWYLGGIASFLNTVEIRELPEDEVQQGD